MSRHVKTIAWAGFWVLAACSAVLTIALGVAQEWAGVFWYTILTGLLVTCAQLMKWNVDLHDRSERKHQDRLAAVRDALEDQKHAAGRGRVDD